MTNSIVLTNLLLNTVLSNVSDTASALKWDLPLPVRQEHVERYRIYHSKSTLVAVFLTNGARFVFGNGHVEDCSLPEAYGRLQDPGEIPRFVGTVRLNQSECQRVAVEAIERLGYSNLLRRLPPSKVTPPPQTRTGTVPRFDFWWKEPTDSGSFINARVEVNAENGSIPYLMLLGDAFSRPEPEAASALFPKQPRERSWSPMPPGAEPLPLAQQEKLFRLIWPEVVEFLVRMGQRELKGASPGEIDRSKSSCFRIEKHMGAVVVTRSGCTVCYKQGHPATFVAPDAYLNGMLGGESDDFVAENVYSHQKLVPIVREYLISELQLDAVRCGFQFEPMWISLGGRVAPGEKVLRRTRFAWCGEVSDRSRQLVLQGAAFFPKTLVCVEADNVTGRITYLDISPACFADTETHEANLTRKLNSED